MFPDCWQQLQSFGLIGTTGSDFLGNISYFANGFTAYYFQEFLWRQVWQFIGLSNKFYCR